MMDDIAHIEATRIVATVEARIADAIREAEKRGYRRGRESMRKDAVSYLEEQRKRFRHLASTADDERQAQHSSSYATAATEFTEAISLIKI